MFYDNFIYLCSTKNKSPSAIVVELGLNKSAVTVWKQGGAPRDSTIRKIADYFQVDAEELKNGKIMPPRELQLSEEESRFLMYFRRVERKDLALSILQALVESEKQSSENDSSGPETSPKPEAPPQKE